MESIKQLFVNAILSENRIEDKRDQKSIIKRYESLLDRNTVDDIFIDICGYSLKTLIEKREDF